MFVFSYIAAQRLDTMIMVRSTIDMTSPMTSHCGGRGPRRANLGSMHDERQQDHVKPLNS